MAKKQDCRGRGDRALLILLCLCYLSVYHAGQRFTTFQWDWQLWFVPKGPPFLPDFWAFLERLLEDSAAVTGLLAKPPFDDGPPRHLRVRVYRYRFATPAQRAGGGLWWVGEDLGPFWPPPRLDAQR